MNKRELQVMGLKEEYLEEYIERHKNVWPEIQECANITLLVTKNTLAQIVMQI